MNLPRTTSPQLAPGLDMAAWPDTPLLRETDDRCTVYHPPRDEIRAIDPANLDLQVLLGGSMSANHHVHDDAMDHELQLLPRALGLQSHLEADLDDPDQWTAPHADERRSAGIAPAPLPGQAAREAPALRAGRAVLGAWLRSVQA